MADAVKAQMSMNMKLDLEELMADLAGWPRRHQRGARRADC